MKKLLLLSALFISILKFNAQVQVSGQRATYENPYPQPIKVQVQQNPANSYSNNAQNISNNLKARAAQQAAQQAANANNFEKIEIDKLKGLPNKFKYVIIKKLKGWEVIENYKLICEEIRLGGKYILINDIGTQDVYRGKIKNSKTIKKSKIFEPKIPPINDITKEKTIFFEWDREASLYDRFTRIVLKTSNNEVIYQAEYKNKYYLEMLRPLVTDYLINKKEAKQKLIELKEYLDLGIISEEDFINSSMQLKKILLDN